MNKKGNLFSLIASMSTTERDAFLLLHSRNEAKKNYIQLFNFIYDCQIVSDDEVRKYFVGHKFLKQLHVTKNYLYNQILKSLRHTNFDTSITLKLKNTLINVEILFKRELYSHCYYELKKAKELALKYERNEILLEVLRWERTMQQSAMENKSKLNGFGEILVEERQALRHLSIYHDYLNLSYSALAQGYDPEHLHRISESKLLEREVSYDPLQTKVMHYHVLYVYHTMSGDGAKGNKAIETLTAEIERYPHRISEDPKPYITAINNKIGALLYQKSYQEIPELLSKIRDIPSSYDLPLNNYLRRVMARSFNMEMELYRDTKQVDEGLELIPQIIDFLDDNMQKLAPEYIINLYYQFAYVNFMNRDFRTTLKYANEIIGGSFGNNREEIQGYARLLNLIVHYELENITVLKYAIHSTRRFLKKKKTLQPFETRLLKLFSQLCTSPFSEHKQLFIKANNEIFGGMEQGNIDHILDYLNFTGWFESKIKLNGSGNNHTI